MAQLQPQFFCNCFNWRCLLWHWFFCPSTMAEFLALLFIIRTGSLHKHMRLTEAEVLPKRTIKNKNWRIATWRELNPGATDRRWPAGTPWVSTARFIQWWRPASCTYREHEKDKSNHMHVRWRSFLPIPLLLYIVRFSCWKLWNFLLAFPVSGGLVLRAKFCWAYTVVLYFPTS